MLPDYAADWPKPKRVTDINDPDTAAEYLAIATDNFRHKNLAGMGEALQRMSASPDCSAMHRFEAAKLFAAAGLTSDAIQFYREAGAAFIDPEGDTGRARESFSEAHSLDIENLDTIFEIGRVDMIEGHPRAALAKFSHILRKSDQGHVPALFEAACIYQELGQHDQAVLTLRKVLDRDKSNVQAIVSMGQRLQSMGMLPEAVGYFIEAASAARAAGQMGIFRHVINFAIGLDPTNQQARRMIDEVDDPVLEGGHDEHVRSVPTPKIASPPPPIVAPPTPSLVVPEAVAGIDAEVEAELNELSGRSDRMQRKISALASTVAELEETVATLVAEMAEMKPLLTAIKLKPPKVAMNPVAVKRKASDESAPDSEAKPRKRPPAKVRRTRR